ncbi:MAG: hypothetical protein KC417_13830 [Myxococcales bacterium]|nr:hypothetical protein [Myxococcales bacterium]
MKTAAAPNPNPPQAPAPKPQNLPDPREVLRIARSEILGLQIAQKLF